MSRLSRLWNCFNFWNDWSDWNDWYGYNVSIYNKVLLDTILFLVSNSSKFKFKMATVNWRRKLASIIKFLVVLRRKKKRSKRKQCYWIRYIFKKREELAVFYTLAQEMQLNDSENLFRYDSSYFNSPQKKHHIFIFLFHICVILLVNIQLI